MQNTNLISAEVVADSLNQYGERLTTLKLVFPRYILAEAKTHRLLSQDDSTFVLEENLSINSFIEGSKNSASSRAIPFKKMVKQVMETPFIPMAWQREHKGMQGTEYITDEASLIDINQDWLEARDNAVTIASRLNHGFWIKEGEEYGEDRVTKQLCNRLLEPFLYHTVLLTASHFENFFNLRCPRYTIDEEVFKSKKDAMRQITMIAGEIDWKHLNSGQADIHIMDLAEKMWDAMNDSEPKQLKIGQWHIPFGDQLDYGLLGDLSHNRTDEKSIEKLKLKVATARCARISYQTLGDNPAINYAKDIELHDMLLESGHFSPFEHCAQVMNGDEYFSHVKGIMKLDDMSIDDEYAYVSNGVAKPNVFGWSRNFKGFKQYRELLDEERRPEQTS